MLYWTTIAQATQPLAGSTGHAASSIWSDLYRTATAKQRDRAWTWRQGFFIALWVIGLLLAFGGGWVLAFALR